MDLFNTWLTYERVYQKLARVPDKLLKCVYRRDPDILTDMAEWNDHLTEQALTANSGAEPLFDPSNWTLGVYKAIVKCLGRNNQLNSSLMMKSQVAVSVSAESTPTTQTHGFHFFPGLDSLDVSKKTIIDSQQQGDQGNGTPGVQSSNNSHPPDPQHQMAKVVAIL